MEPRPHERGKVDAGRLAMNQQHALQWSHVLTNVESVDDCVPMILTRDALQWSHVLTNVESRQNNPASVA